MLVNCRIVYASIFVYFSVREFNSRLLLPIFRNKLYGCRLRVRNFGWKYIVVLFMRAYLFISVYVNLTADCYSPFSAINCTDAVCGW